MNIVDKIINSNLSLETQDILIKYLSINKINETTCSLIAKVPYILSKDKFETNILLLKHKVTDLYLYTVETSERLEVSPAILLNQTKLSIKNLFNGVELPSGYILGLDEFIEYINIKSSFKQFTKQKEKEYKIE